jgi:hypothetical protein
MWLIVLGFFALLGFKLIPLYLEAYKIQKAFTGIINDPGVGTKTKREIQKLALRRLDIDSVYRINHRNFSDYVEIKKKDDRIRINVYYEAEAPLVANLRLVAEFDEDFEN